MPASAQPTRLAPLRLIAFLAVIALALIANRIWPRPNTPEPGTGALPNQVFPVSAGAFTMVALEPPSALGRHELWARYRAARLGHEAYVSLSYGVSSFHNWIGCFLIEGPQPLWSGTLTIPARARTSRVEVTVLRQPGTLRAVAHSECWQGSWRGSEWQDRWFALWHTPGQPIPLLNAYAVQPDSNDPAAVKKLRNQLQQFLSGLNWDRLNDVCQLRALTAQPASTRGGR